MSQSHSSVQIELLNAHGVSEGTFSPKQGQSFAEAAQDAGLFISTSCCSGACFVCACRVKEGLDKVDIGLVSVPLVDIDMDQVLTCVGGVRDDLFADGQFHKIVLQKLV